MFVLADVVSCHTNTDLLPTKSKAIESAAMRRHKKRSLGRATHLHNPYSCSYPCSYIDSGVRSQLEAMPKRDGSLVTGESLPPKKHARTEADPSNTSSPCLRSYRMIFGDLHISSLSENMSGYWKGC